MEMRKCSREKEKKRNQWLCLLGLKFNTIIYVCIAVTETETKNDSKILILILILVLDDRMGAVCMCVCVPQNYNGTIVIQLNRRWKKDNLEIDLQQQQHHHHHHRHHTNGLTYAFAFWQRIWLQCIANNKRTTQTNGIRHTIQSFIKNSIQYVPTYLYPVRMA